MKTSVAGHGERAGMFHLRVGRVALESQVRQDVSLHPGGHLGKRPRRISTYSAVTIASWWRRRYPILGALVDHYPVERAHLDSELDRLARDLELDTASNQFDVNAVRALRHFVDTYEDEN